MLKMGMVLIVKIPHSPDGHDRLTKNDILYTVSNIYKNEDLGAKLGRRDFYISIEILNPSSGHISTWSRDTETMLEKTISTYYTLIDNE